LRQEQFDIVHSFFVEANILAPVLGKLTGIPVRIGSRRNLNHWMTARFRLFQSTSNLFVTRLAANCCAVKRRVEQSEWFAAGKIDVLYNGLDVEQFAPNKELRAVTRNALGISNEEVVVGNTSTLRSPKGVDDFLRATAIVAQQSNIRILLVGDGPLRPQLEQLAGELNVKGRTIFAGAQTNVPPWLHAMDIAVLSSHAEGFSNSILEYIAAGLPCVVTDAGGNAEAIDGCGKVVPIGNTRCLAEEILALVKSASLRQELSQKSLLRAAAFSLPQAQRTLISYYRDLWASR
jgi:glycosyltransferase involved in cell wall biosynthesis